MPINIHFNKKNFLEHLEEWGVTPEIWVGSFSRGIGQFKGAGGRFWFSDLFLGASVHTSKRFQGFGVLCFLALYYVGLYFIGGILG